MQNNLEEFCSIDKLLLEQMAELKESNETFFMLDFQKTLVKIQSLLSIEAGGLKNPLFESFLTDFLVPFAKNLTKIGSLKNQDFNTIVYSLLDNLLRISLKAIFDEQDKGLELLKALMDPSKAFFRLADRQEESGLFNVIYFLT